MADLLTLLNTDPALRDATRLTADRMPRLVVSRSGAVGGFQNLFASFQTVMVNSVQIDNFNTFDTSTGEWVVPETGTYEVNGKLRLEDGARGSLSYGIGLDVANVDNSGFFWSQGTNNRQGIFNSRIIMLTAGQRLRLYAYVDSPGVGASTAELNATRIA